VKVTERIAVVVVPTMLGEQGADDILVGVAELVELDQINGGEVSGSVVYVETTGAVDSSVVSEDFEDGSELGKGLISLKDRGYDFKGLPALDSPAIRASD
jgi:hypothetical protein